MKNESSLNDKTRQLLMEYVDGCCGWWQRRKVSSLLNRSQQARNFVDELQGLSSEMQMGVSQQVNSAPVDLWDKIETRIEQEERAAFYLGERHLLDQPKNPGFNWRQSWLIGAPAGAVAALLAVVVMSQGSNGDLVNSLGQQAGFFEAPASNMLVPVAQTVSSNPRSTNDMEMEWLRSHGRVQMIPHSNGQTPVIWISRTDAIRQWQAANRGKAIASIPTRNSNGIEIIERGIPNAFTVANDGSK